MQVRILLRSQNNPAESKQITNMVNSVELKSRVDGGEDVFFWSETHAIGAEIHKPQGTRPNWAGTYTIIVNGEYRSFKTWAGAYKHLCSLVGKYSLEEQVTEI